MSLESPSSPSKKRRFPWGLTSLREWWKKDVRETFRHRYNAGLADYFTGHHDPPDDLRERTSRVTKDTLRKRRLVGVLGGLVLVVLLYVLVRGSRSSAHASHLTVPEYSPDDFVARRPDGIGERLETYMGIHNDYPCAAAIDIGWSWQHMAVRTEAEPTRIRHLIHPLPIAFASVHGQDVGYTLDNHVFGSESITAGGRRVLRRQSWMPEPVHTLHRLDESQTSRECWRWDAVTVEYEEVELHRADRRPRQIKTFVHDLAQCMQYYLDLFLQNDTCSHRH
jgi:hypothetical protein